MFGVSVVKKSIKKRKTQQIWGSFNFGIYQNCLNPESSWLVTDVLKYTTFCHFEMNFPEKKKEKYSQFSMHIIKEEHTSSVLKMFFSKKTGK